MHEFSISLVIFSGVVDRFCGEISSTLYVSLFKELCVSNCVKKQKTCLTWITFVIYLIILWSNCHSSAVHDLYILYLFIYVFDLDF